MQRDSGSHDEHRYRQQLYGTPALSRFLYFHGMLFTSWVVLFVTQTALVAARRSDCTDVPESSALLIASLRRDFGGGSFYEGYITAVRVEHFICRRILGG